MILKSTDQSWGPSSAMGTAGARRWGRDIFLCRPMVDAEGYRFDSRRLPWYTWETPKRSADLHWSGGWSLRQTRGFKIRKASYTLPWTNMFEVRSLCSSAIYLWWCRIRSHTVARGAFRESSRRIWAERSSECRCSGWGLGKHAWMVVHHWIFLSKTCNQPVQDGHRSCAGVQQLRKSSHESAGEETAFPVAQWKANIDLLHDTAIRLSREKASSTKGFKTAGKSCTGTASARLAFPPSLVYPRGRASLHLVFLKLSLPLYLLGRT